ncbi:NAD(P)-dependent alcohol dehydrogenase [Roseateles sp. SL47]|uniref:zinc-dependent alcohol dehydrogenase family protein n=1 Tax=Roseateles sp. SL47 TaxID=2995138 RepID=UPI002271A537|nr:NAD(P)-dependent alcohol dehydrogenase [Roseateles sp. SL47]WAC71988.1 NAD(P)-dependent alcohol dehydrogenase [Roseateles sp. SL47]
MLKVRAVCLNHRDLLMIQGTYGPRRPEHRVPVSDGVGEVLHVGAGVAGFSVGDRVICPHFATWLDGAFDLRYFGEDLGITQDGWLAEQIVVPAQSLVKVPDALTDSQAAALSAAALTAWNALVDVGQIKAGDLVLALGTGGVSIFALQLAKLHGARVAITSSSDQKLSQARKLGADITINYRTHPNWAAELLNANGQRGADIVVETGGLATLASSIAAAAPNGRLALIGALAATPAEGAPTLDNLFGIVGKNLTLRGITAGNRRMLQSLVNAISVGNIEPVIDKELSFDEAPEAYRHLLGGHHLGKVLIRVSD